MPHPIRPLVIVASLLLAGAGIAGCGSSGSDAATTTEATTTTTAATTTTEATTTTAADGSTTTTLPADAESGDVDCQALLQEYAEVFDPDDLSSTVEFFRTYEASMPDDVAAATERLAAAYEKAGDLGHLDMGSVDLTADAQTFSDWTNDGCPAG